MTYTSACRAKLIRVLLPHSLLQWIVVGGLLTLL